MHDILPFINGLVAGTVYGSPPARSCWGFKSSGIFNFGHGAILAAGALVFDGLRVPWFLPLSDGRRYKVTMFDVNVFGAEILIAGIAAACVIGSVVWRPPVITRSCTALRSGS